MPTQETEVKLLHSYDLLVAMYIQNSNDYLVLPKMEQKFTEKCYQKLTKKLTKIGESVFHNMFALQVNM